MQVVTLDEQWFVGMHGRPPPRRPVGTHGLCVRCSTILTMYLLTGTDALSLETSVRAYKSLHVSWSGYIMQNE